MSLSRAILFTAATAGLLATARAENPPRADRHDSRGADPIAQESASPASAQSGSPGHPENLRFLQSYLWLGYVDHDQSVSFTFNLKNDSDQVVKIASAEASCRCTSPEGKIPEEIPAHGTGSFQWTFSAARSAGGFESKEITITTADGKDLVGKFGAWVGQPDEAAGKPKAPSGSK